MNSKERNILLFIIICIIFIGVGIYLLKSKNNPSTIEKNTEQKTKLTSTKKSKEIKTLQTNIKTYIDKDESKITEEYNSNEILVKKTSYWSNNIIIWKIEEYNPTNGQRIKTTFYQLDGQTIDAIGEFNENEKLIKLTFYHPNGQTIKQINEYNEHGQRNKTTHYNPDGTIKSQY
ncbi:DUF2963 domain-containing protein [Candidatus Phytoplasma sp. AldY-WA1]|uniref:DUF2963 domain-containing protein n=1 Tax=Candidatus Phytoplasma sp. AldY-WA1 TaxID=2852100 RepID=UPI00254A824F|nr:DUF2963 domain-containing protein [Candidatus Phytoplasma sp. AldY-WA1]